MVKISKEWHDARLEILNEFWEDKIDFEIFKKRIEEIDRLFKGKGKSLGKDPKVRIKELEDLAKERCIGKDGINTSDFLTDDEYEELLELEEKLEENNN